MFVGGGRRACVKVSFSLFGHGQPCRQLGLAEGSEQSVFRVIYRVYQAGAANIVLSLVDSAAAQTRVADPQGSGPILAAVEWLQGTLLGNVATAVAVIAVALVGFMMLTGRMNWRYGITVIVGCFILFGAASIVSGIQSAAGAAG